MSKEFVHVREVAVHRVPGIRRGEGFKLEDLSPNINILFGPNGAGKSTTCRVIQELLWPGKLERPSVDGVIAGADGEWRIEIDAGHVQSLRDGKPAAPEFGSADSRPRYHLGLKEFIVDDNADFARKIAEASQGGYDLDAAAAALNYSPRPTGPKSLRDELEQRELEVQSAQDAQREIERQARSLADLEKQEDEADEAAAEFQRLKKVQTYHKAAEQCRTIEAERDAFPKGISRLRGDENKILRDLDEKERRLNEQLASEEERLRHANEELEELDLPEDGISSDLLNKLRARKEELRELETRLADQRRRRDDAQTREDEARAVLGPSFTDEQLAAIKKLEQRDLSAFARKADRIRAERAALEERRRWLEADEPDEVKSIDEDELQNGIHALASWLAEAGPSAGASPSASIGLVGAAVTLLVLAVALGVLQQWLWLALAAVGLILAAYEWWSRHRSQARSSGRDAHRQAYRGLSLPEPQTWDAGGIAKHFRELTRWSGLKAMASERRSRLTSLEDEEKVLEKKERELDDRRRELMEHLACRIEIEDEWLPVLVDRISDWQSASAALVASGAVLTKLEEERDELLETINESIEPFAEASIDTAAAAEQCIAELDNRRQRHETAKKDAADARRRIDETIQPELEELADARAALFDRLEIEGEEVALIDDWMARREAYLDCIERLRRETTLRDDRKAALEGYEELLELDEFELERRMQEAEEAADQRDELNRKMGDIEGRIRDAKAGHGLADAIARRDEAREALAGKRDENGRLRVGAALTDWVRQVAIDRSRPQVFRRADELFVRFTRGTLQLQMNDRSSPPAFLARRGRSAPQRLTELSDGERVQLMTAVRLAFLEQDETRPLPLLVDEVLATSDDGRSEVMIDTIVDVARQGRQVFYCTAQHDEVGKWIARLAEEDIDYKLIDLAKIRELSSARTNPLEIEPVEKSAPPSPDGLTYDAYGRELGVPGIDPRAETIDGVHLWHLLDDANLLYQLLVKDISTWGQLETLLKYNGAGLIDVDGDIFERARAAALAVEKACEAWRIGRGRPVDRAALLDSGSVTDKFIDDVTQLAERVGGNAVEILKGLERREVSGFWSTKIEELREFFEEEGYLPVEAPLDPDDIRVRVMADVADELKEGMLKEHVLNRIIGSITAAS